MTMCLIKPISRKHTCSDFASASFRWPSRLKLSSLLRSPDKRLTLDACLQNQTKMTDSKTGAVKIDTDFLQDFSATLRYRIGAPKNVQIVGDRVLFLRAANGRSFVQVQESLEKLSFESFQFDCRACTNSTRRARRSACC